MESRKRKGKKVSSGKCCKTQKENKAKLKIKR